jgi:hypothetical protein
MEKRGARDLSTDGKQDPDDPTLDSINRQFDRLEQLITEQGLETRRHMDAFVERFRAEMRADALRHSQLKQP